MTAIELKKEADRRRVWSRKYGIAPDQRCYSFRYAVGEPYDILEHPDRESARLAALERRSYANRSYTGYPYDFYVVDEFGTEHRAEDLPSI